MDQLKRKGQTALEYLLIVVVAIIVVVAVMAYMNASSSAGISQGMENQQRVVCAAQSCGSNTDCENEDACKHFCTSTGSTPCTGGTMAVTCVGMQSIGVEKVPGHCSTNSSAKYRKF